MADLPTLPAGAGFPLVDATSGEFLSTAVNESLSATTAAQIAASAAPRGVRSSPQIGALVQKLATAVDPAYLIGVGDSTMAAAGGWFNQGVDWLGDQFPAYSILRRDWNHTNQRYEPVPVVVQTGTAGVRRFVATGAATDRIFVVADSAATSPSTQLVTDFDVLIPATGAAITLGGKYVTGTNQRSWFVQVDASGTVSLYFSTDGTSGTQLTRTSTAAIPGGGIGVRATVRVVFNGSTGGNNTAAFYYSTDLGATFTQIGSTVTNSGTQTIFDGTAATQFNARGSSDGSGTGGTGNSTGGAVQYFGLKVFTSVTAGARPVIDYDTAQWNGYSSGAGSWTDFVGNTVQATGSGQTGTMQGAPVLYVLNGAVSGQTISYANDGTRFPKLVPLAADAAVINFSHNEVGLVAYRTPYKQLADAIVVVGPDTGIVATVQNQRVSPATNITEHAIRGDQIRALAASQRHALVDVAAAFTATGDVDANVDTDGIHPNTDGYVVATAEFVSLFNAYIRPEAA
jgi:lysophospholipase L1-like esterase